MDIGRLAKGPADLSSEISADDAIWNDLEAELAESVLVSGEVSEIGPGRYLWRGSIEARVRMSCRRCLVAGEVPLEAEVNAILTEDQDADDPAEYVVPRGARQLDLTDAVREELVLSLEPFALCREDCKGLCPQCGTDLNEGSCSCPPKTDERWASLNALKSQSDE
ncbi:MAG: DUF177 domain-containing protein [Gemmatimonadota bacterium]|nr:DUF177 domain-containing protein [Gemmatimonadota bacterium]